MTETISEQVFIDGSDDEVQLRVQGHSTQTEPLQTWENSVDEILAQVTDGGLLQVGDVPPLSTPTSLLQVHRDKLSIDKPTRGLQVSGELEDEQSSDVQWSVHELTVSGNSTALTSATALQASVTVDDAPLESAVGIGVEISKLNDEELTEAIGLHIADVDQATSNYALFTGKGVVHLGDHQELSIASESPADNPPEDFIKLYPKLLDDVPTLYLKDSSGTEHVIQGEFTGDAGDVPYTPGEGNDWIEDPAPTTVQEALDYLAAREGVGSGPWDPSKTRHSLLLWYEVGKETIYSDDDDVTVLHDWSGNGNHAYVIGTVDQDGDLKYHSGSGHPYMIAPATGDRRLRCLGFPRMGCRPRTIIGICEYSSGGVHVVIGRAWTDQGVNALSKSDFTIWGEDLYFTDLQNGVNIGIVTYDSEAITIYEWDGDDGYNLVTSETRYINTLDELHLFGYSDGTQIVREKPFYACFIWDGVLDSEDLENAIAYSTSLFSS